MKKTVEAWKAVDPGVVAEQCSPAHIRNLVQDAKMDVLALHQAHLEAINKAGNGLLPLLSSAAEMAALGGWPLSQQDTAACLSQIQDALDIMRKATS